MVAHGVTPLTAFQQLLGVVAPWDWLLRGQKATEVATPVRGVGLLLLVVESP